MQVIHFEDKGQDFLEWDVDQNGMVVGSRPYQADVWRGCEVSGLAIGVCPMVKGPDGGPARMLRYVVTAMELINPFNQPGRTYGAVDVTSRLHALERFTLAQCQAALEVPGVQQAVVTKLRSRIRQLEKLAAAAGEA